MLKFWHVSLLVLIALIWKVRPASALMDVCDLTFSNSSMYCTCDERSRNDLEITCYVIGPASPNHEVWTAFRRHENTVAFSIQPRQPSQLQFIPIQALQSLPSLMTFTIQESNIEILESGIISDMPKLKNLYLTRNGIIAMERYSIANLPKLKKLALSENYITNVLADTFSELDELEELYLDRNNISHIEGCAFCNLHNLKEMELWKNNIETLTERTFRGLRYLERLDLFNNQLKSLEGDVFSSMPRLRELDLKNNVIEYIDPRTFSGLTDLTILKLTNNQIKILPDGVFDPMPKLMQLDVSINKLVTLQREVMESLHNSMNHHFTFFFRSNPIECNCELNWLRRWVMKAKNPRFVQELRQSKCITPTGDEEVIHDLELKPCDKTTKMAKIAKLAPQASTPKFHPKEGTSSKYDSEYSDDTENPTEYAYSDNELKVLGSSKGDTLLCTTFVLFSSFVVGLL